MKKRLKHNPLELDIRDDRLFDPLSCVFGILSVVFLAFVYWYFGFDTFKSVLQIIGLMAGIIFVAKIYWEGCIKNV